MPILIAKFGTMNLKYLTLSLIMCFYCCQGQNLELQEQQNEYNIIPLPQKVIPQKGKFVINEKTTISFKEEEAAIKSIAQDLQKAIQQATGLRLNITGKGENNIQVNSIQFQIDKSLSKEEGYALICTPKQIVIKAQKPIGLFYGFQTLMQLFPPQLEKGSNSIVIPSVEISDNPRFSYRGIHLDVSRHFFDVATIKELIDQLAYYKINYFHWHLTDDQGWRIEIKQYPKLTEVGAFRNGTLIGHYNDQPHQFDGKRYGDFYTQEEIREVVRYAQDRFITIIPEIEMPGHAQAVLAAYPELGCDDGQYEVWQKWGISDNVFCPKEETFEFLENVLEEVMDLFPGQYIHVGGDECPKIKWKESAFCQDLMKKEELKDEHELQGYFIRRMEDYILSKGRKIIGWDEIMEGNLISKNATIMSWRGIEGGIEAAKLGHSVVMTPTSHCYFDYYQSDHPDEPLAIGGFTPLKKVYEYNPIPEELNEQQSQYILGAQGNLWTEYIPTTSKLHYMLFPRLCALAETVWTNESNKNFETFVDRLPTHLNRLESLGIRPANHLYDLNSSVKPSVAPSNGRVSVSFETLSKEAQIYYTLGGSPVNLQSTLYKQAFYLSSDTEINAQSYLMGEKTGRAFHQSIKMHKAAGLSPELKSLPHPKYKGDGNGSLFNGVLGSNERYGDKEWLGFDGKDFEAVLDFGKIENFQEASFRFFNGEGQWIYLPSEVTLLISEDGQNYTEIANETQIAGNDKVVEKTLPMDNSKGRYLKIIVKNYGVIPDGSQGAGNRAWLFIDEIQIK